MKRKRYNTKFRRRAGDASVPLSNTGLQSSKSGAVQYSTSFLDKTIDVFQPLTSRKLTYEDARQIIENTTGFYKLLLEWDAAEQKTSNLKK